MASKKIGIYPGTFDPVTNGHLDIIRRAASNIVDHLIIGVAVNAGKGPLFTVEERVEMVEDQVGWVQEKTGAVIEVRPFENLLMNFATSCNAAVIVRGLRAVSDFEYEFQMAGMNARINPEIETVFLMASERTQFISSRFVKEIGRLEGDISQFVPADVRDRLLEKFDKGA